MSATASPVPEHRHLEWFYTEVAAHLVTFSVDHANIIAVHHVARHGVPAASSLAQMRDAARQVDARTGDEWAARGFFPIADAVPLTLPLSSAGTRMLVAPTQEVYLRADMQPINSQNVEAYDFQFAAELNARRVEVTSITPTSTAHYRQLAEVLPLAHPEMLGNLWRIGMVVDVITDDTPWEYSLVSIRNQAPFVTTISPSMSLDQAWTAVPFYASKSKQAETAILEAMFFTFDRPAWRWTSPDKIHRTGGKKNWNSACAAYILAARVGMDFHPSPWGASWLAHYQNGTESSGHVENTEMDWNQVLKLAGRGEAVLRGECGIATTGHSPFSADHHPAS